MRPEESFIQQPVRSLQTMLRVLSEQDRNHPTVVPDGIYGQTTANAVSSFQRMHGIPVTGITDQSIFLSNRPARVSELGISRVEFAVAITKTRLSFTSSIHA